VFDKNHSLWAAGLLKNCIGMQDFSRIIHICHYVLETQNIEGDIVEFGCFVGHTTKLLTLITNKQIHVYDSFEGLPNSIENYPGRMDTGGTKPLIKNFENDNLKLPIINKGWFRDIDQKNVPDKICFAHLDGDLYDSTLDSLILVYDKVQPGGVILIDDYLADEWPGVEKAVKEFFRDKPEEIVSLKGLNDNIAHKAMIRKK
jgi:O-methyltransferase